VDKVLQMDDTSYNKREIIKGRGAVSNISGRFEQHDHETFDDGWDSPAEESRPKTQVQTDASRHPVPGTLYLIQLCHLTSRGIN
jgi:hypothetical protein